jgi:hypothetical protein
MDPQTRLSPEFERYENGSEAAERALIEALAVKIGFLQQFHRDRRTGRLHCGTHAKGMTCGDARFEVLDVAAANPGAPADVVARLRRGLFRAPASYPARARFANGVSEPRDDRLPDERALSFSVDLGDGRRQDFSMNSASIFPIPSLSAFNFVFTLSLLKGRREGKASDAAKAYLNSRLRAALRPGTLARIPEAVRTIRSALRVTRRPVASFRRTYYWSGTAFSHGEADAVKYLMAPCLGEALGPPPEGAGANFLQEDLREGVNTRAEPLAFDFRVQFLDAARMKVNGRSYEPWRWVEDPTLDWDAAGAADWLVARLTIAPGSIADDCDDPALFPAFDVCANSLPEHKPLGRINRGRAVVELRSRENRA